MKNKLFSAALLLIAVGFIGIGLARGEGAEVLNKGINLCLECVGIG